MPKDKHDDAVARGLLRYGPVCDGVEVTDESVGAMGYGSKGFREAVFLRSYSKDITLISPEEDHGLKDDEFDRLRTVGIALEVGPLTSIDLGDGAIVVSSPTGMHRFPSVYAALGSDIRSSLAGDVGRLV
ncbi:hypothetical protein [Rhizobium sp. Root1204]|uniref:hypothetical protein n=1 Tax=unclassified Rhizobium TaxID=2613769 RepID=UPI000B10E1E0